MCVPVKCFVIIELRNLNRSLITIVQTAIGHTTDDLQVDILYKFSQFIKKGQLPPHVCTYIRVYICTYIYICICLCSVAARYLYMILSLLPLSKLHFHRDRNKTTHIHIRIPPVSMYINI